MKTPLRFQVTEFDCGTISLLNAFSYVFHREEIPAELVKAIQEYTMDSCDKYGNIGQGGTSRGAIKQFSFWLMEYAKLNKFNVACKYLEKSEVTLRKIIECLDRGGVCFIRCWLVNEHYVIITKIINRQVYIFDPYYLDISKYKDSQVKIITNKPFNYNRKVSFRRVFSEAKKDFSLGSVNGRQCILINRE